MANQHESLLASMHQYLWNEYPQTRYTSHANFNGLPLILERMLPQALKMRIIPTLKAVGLVKGVLDYEWFHNGRLYMFDAKVGTDKLSKEQKECIAALEANGGAGCEIRSLEQFKLEIDSIINNGCLTSER